MALLAVGCVKSGQGFVQDDQRIVTIGAGTAQLGGGNHFFAWYFVDRTTQTCWMEIGEIGGQLDCCVVRRAKEAVKYITWESDQSCGARSAKPDASANTAPVWTTPAQ